MNRFIVAVANLREDEKKKFRQSLEEKEIIICHWIDDVWLLVDKLGDQNANELRDSFAEVVPDHHNIVIQLKDLNNVRIAALVPHDLTKRVDAWLNEHWYDR